MISDDDVLTNPERMEAQLLCSGSKGANELRRCIKVQRKQDTEFHNVLRSDPGDMNVFRGFFGEFFWIYGGDERIDATGLIHRQRTDYSAM